MTLVEHIELFERLNQEDEFLPFDCGDADLNDYLLTSAKDYQRQLLAVTYYMADRSETILFFRLSNDKITVFEGSSSF